MGRVVAILLCYYGWAAAAIGSASCQEFKPKQFWAEAARTAKERLSGKSTDEQRVGNSAAQHPTRFRAVKRACLECGGPIANWRNGRRVSRGDQIL
jgi:hypothetical protein